MIGIVAHTSRAEQAHRLAETVGAVYTSIDNGRLGCNRNHHKTWTWLLQHNNSDWITVLEDDAKPVPNFRQQLAETQKTSPSPILSLYLGKKRPPHWQEAMKAATEKADKADACFITAPLLLHAVAVTIHKDIISDLLPAIEHTTRPWDYAIGIWALQHHEPVSYTWPSLCDHKDGPTVAKHPDRKPRPPGRTAWRTGTRTIWRTEPTIDMRE